MFDNISLWESREYIVYFYRIKVDIFGYFWIGDRECSVVVVVEGCDDK